MLFLISEDYPAANRGGDPRCGSREDCGQEKSPVVFMIVHHNEDYVRWSARHLK